jgi:hypothetical protein
MPVMQFTSLNLVPIIEAIVLAALGRENLADLTLYYKEMFPHVMNGQIYPFSFSSPKFGRNSNDWKSTRINERRL